ncbi:MAG: VirB4 family type IV secretion/conjugal transfer ATPase, partial [Pseudomonadota bacterium]
MTVTALKKTKRGAPLTQQTPLSDFVPYSHHVDQYTITTKDGYLLQVIQLDGFPFETTDQSELNQRKYVLNTLWRGLGSSRFALYHHILRHLTLNYPVGQFTGFSRELDQASRERLGRRQLFINDQYLTVIRRPLRGGVGFLETASKILSGKSDRESYTEDRRVELKALTDAVDNIVATLKPYGARRLSTYKKADGTYSRVLEFLSTLINQSAQPVFLPRAPLDQYLPNQRYFFGEETLEVRGISGSTLGAMVSIKEYGPETAPGLLDALLRLPHEFVLTQSFAFIDQQAALNRLEQVQRLMDSAEDRAVSLKEQLSNATDATASGRIAFGEHHLTLLIKETNPTRLDHAVTDVSSELTKRGLVAVREDLNLEAAFWAQLPGNFPFIARRAPISSANFSGFASFHDYPIGQFENNHWGPCVAVLETTSGTPYA